MLRVAALLLMLMPAPLFAQVKVTRILDTPETDCASWAVAGALLQGRHHARLP
jgi:hypothetical protein